MARIRTIKPEFCTSADTGALSRDARLFFLQLLTEADDAGRLAWIPRRLTGVLYPFDEDVTGSMLTGWALECQARAMVLIYTVAGSQYLQIANWDKHQKISHPSASRIPAYSGNPPEPPTKPSGVPPEPLRPDLGIDLGKGREGEQGSAAPAKPGACNFAQWTERLNGEQAIPPDDPVFAYAERVGIPADFLELAWLWFERTYCRGGMRERKRYTDWRKVFRNAVEGNWAKAWHFDGERYGLTTPGAQLRKDIRSAA